LMRPTLLRSEGWLFRTSRGHGGDLLSEKPMGQPDAWRMIRRRAAAAGIAEEIGCHTFRATGITAYLANGGALEHAKEMADTRAREPPSFMTGQKSGSLKRKVSASGSRSLCEKQDFCTNRQIGDRVVCWRRFSRYSAITPSSLAEHAT
jgi:hypothetical protein